VILKKISFSKLASGILFDNKGVIHGMTEGSFEMLDIQRTTKATYNHDEHKK
jgi:hypothetical protein